MFDLPAEILDTLALKGNPGHDLEPEDEVRSDPRVPTTGGSIDESKKALDDTQAAATSCGLCSLHFASIQEQRDHVKSDLHGYNLKQKMRGSKPVREADFEKLVGGK